MKKTYVLDTNVLMNDPDAIYSFEDNDIVIPLVVVEELDKHKSRQDEVGRNARQVSRALDELRQMGDLMGVGIELTPGTLRVMAANETVAASLPIEFRSNAADNLILAIALELNKSAHTVLVSMDTNVRIKAQSLGVIAETYERMNVVKNIDEIYTGLETIEVGQDVIDEFYSNGQVVVNFERFPRMDYHPNQFFIMKCGSSSAIGRFYQEVKTIKKLNPIKEVFGLKPRNTEQMMAFDLLMDPNVELVSLIGTSGVGKTVCALAACLQQMMGENPLYEKIIITKSLVSVGQEVGTLPGTVYDKVINYMQSYCDSLNLLMGDKKKKTPKTNGKATTGFETKMHQNAYLDLMLEKNLIEIQPISYIRGRSFSPKTILVVDEVQNLSRGEIKAVASRMSNESKIIVLGDIEQIDNHRLDVLNNGLTHVVNSFQPVDLAGHLTLKKGERSRLSAIASKIL